MKHGGEAFYASHCLNWVRAILGEQWRTADVRDRTLDFQQLVQRLREDIPVPPSSEEPK